MENFRKNVQIRGQNRNLLTNHGKILRQIIKSWLKSWKHCRKRQHFYISKKVSYEMTRYIIDWIEKIVTQMDKFTDKY